MVYTNTENFDSALKLAFCGGYESNSKIMLDARIRHVGFLDGIHLCIYICYFTTTN